MYRSSLIFCALFFALSGTLHAQGAPANTKAGGTAADGSHSRFAGWNIEYRLPQGWNVAQSAVRLHTLASHNEAGAIFLSPGMYRNAQEAITDLSQFYPMMNLQAYPLEAPQSTTIAGLQATVATYVGRDQVGRPVQGRFISLLTSYGTGLNMLAMTTPEQMPRLRATLDPVAASVKDKPPAVNQQAVAALAGTWLLYSGSAGAGSSISGGSHSHEETVVFEGRGNDRWQSSSVSVGGAGRATSDADQGTYTVIGNTLVTKGTKGQLVVDIQIQGNRLVAGGKTFLRN